MLSFGFPRLLVRHTDQGYELLQFTPNDELILVERFARCEEALQRWEQIENRSPKTPLEP